MSTWKKKLGLALAGLALTGIGKGVAQAATFADISVVVQVQVISITVASTTWVISEGGTVVPGSVHTSSAIAVTNNANVQEDYRLSLAEDGGWTPSADATADNNEFVLLALFTDTPATNMNDALFNDGGGTDDVVTTSLQTATANLFAINANGIGEKGYDVPFGQQRNLYLDFRTPTTNSVTETQYITVTVTAIAG
jgi:hypothetical protein